MAHLRLREDGQTLVEYALIMTLIVLVVLSALTAFGAAISPLITAILPAL
jgi:Flp pilus assembly pilin Flp